MSEWIEFEGRIETMPWGDSVYTVLPLPDDVVSALKRVQARRVDIELNDHPFNLAITKAPALSVPFLYTGKRILKEIDAEPGETLDVRVRAADDKTVDVPEDVHAAVRAAGKSDLWAKLTPGKMRGLLHTVSTAKRADTRAGRIEKLVKDL